jgi:hypothetical protein
MTLVSRTGTELVFALHDWERVSLAAVLSHYPQSPPGSIEWTRGGLGAADGRDDAFHEELFAGNQETNCVRVRKFITEKLAGPDKDDSSHIVPLPLAVEEINWLLQVLNDIRVGGWIKLGRPDEAALKKLEQTRDASAAVGLMGFCGYVQTLLLDAVMEGGDPPETH